MKQLNVLKLSVLALAILSLHLPKLNAMEEDADGNTVPRNAFSALEKKEQDTREENEEALVIIDNKIGAKTARSNSATNKLVQSLITKAFYVGYHQLDPLTASTRRESLLETYEADALKCYNEEGTAIDSIYIPSRSERPTGNVLVICLNTTYQDHKSSHWEPFLKNGADIVLWNPTELGGVAYSRDLSAVLSTLRKLKPDQVIAVKTYCASSDPAIKAIADQHDENIHLIIDRGYGDIKQLARSFTIVAKLPIVQTVLQEKFDCNGRNNINHIKGKIFFIYSPNDQVMNYGSRNLSRDLWSTHGSDNSTIIRLESQDHWSPWNFETYNQVFRFLSDVRIMQDNYEEVSDNQFPTRSLSYFKRDCLPYLIKSWF